MAYRILRPLGLLLLVLLLGVVTGCGGDDAAATEDEKVEKAPSDIEERLEKEGPLVGLGEAPPPSDAAEWETDFSKRLVPLDEFQSGGPPKDGIPAIDIPHFAATKEIDWIEDREPVISVTVGGETRGYPLQILTWHEIANDELGGVPIAVTFCPLCNTAIVFDRRLGGDVLSFGTTGKLRDSDLVMYDRQTESWWQQFSGEALVGELAGEKLRQLPVRIISWKDFRSEQPDGLVLDRETGFSRDYGTNPYVGYDDVESSPIFATRGDDDERLLPKERVVYVEVGAEAFAVPFSWLAERRRVEIETDEGALIVRWRRGVASALDTSAISAGRDIGAASVELAGDPVPFSEPFWFAVAAFRSDVEIVDG